MPRTLIAPPCEGDFYTLRGFARAVSISRSSVYKEIKAGRLKVGKNGTATVIPAEEAQAWIAALPEYVRSFDPALE